MSEIPVGSRVSVTIKDAVVLDSESGLDMVTIAYGGLEIDVRPEIITGVKTPAPQWIEGDVVSYGYGDFALSAIRDGDGGWRKPTGKNSGKVVHDDLAILSMLDRGDAVEIVTNGKVVKR